MTKVIFTFILLFGFSAFADHLPGEHEHDDEVKPEVHFRYIIKDDSWTHISELTASDGHFDRTFFSFRWASLYRFHRNVKAGVFYIHQRGAVHGDDWQRDGSGAWDWIDTSDRGEDIFGIDVSPRMHLTDQLIGHLKVRYMHYFFNGHELTRVRPGLTYFWLKNGQPYWNIYFHYERYIPANFGDRSLYKEWFYLGGLYHYSASFKPGVFLGHKNTIWTTSEEFSEVFPNIDYEFSEQNLVVGLTFTWFHQ